ncbi:MAG: hypothetical protein ACHQKY_15285 [Terriglobia bacterium]
MRLTKLAHNADWLMSVIILGALSIVVAPQTHDQGTLLLDFTQPVPREQQVTAVAGMTGGGVQGEPLPRGYPLPFAVQLESISPQRVRPGENFTLDLLLRNSGDQAFYLPASRNSVAVFKPGNKEQRNINFGVIFEDPANGRQIFSVVAVGSGSSTVPGSLLIVEPGQRVRVHAKGDLFPIQGWLKAGIKQVRVRAEVCEWKYEENRYFIESYSERVLSANTIMLGIAPPK